MSTEHIQKIIVKNSIATDFVVGTPGAPDRDTTELTLRNVAVLSDRLSPHDLRQLAPESADALRKVADEAAKLVTVAAADAERRPTETAEEHRNRVELELPLHGLQAAVNTGELDLTQEGVAAAVKRAVWLGSVAFEGIMNDPATRDFGAVQETVSYFDGNATAAVRRAQRASA